MDVRPQEDPVVPDLYEQMTEPTQGHVAWHVSERTEDLLRAPEST